jgi:drug/metabolite transporter (DMT)-like permease
MTWASKRMSIVLTQRKMATAAGIVAILSWSTTVALARSVSEQLGPLTGAAAVYLVAAVASAPSLRKLFAGGKSTPGHSRKYLLGCGALFVTYMLALYLGLGLAKDRQQVLEVGLLNYLWPVLTLLLSVALLRQPARWTLLPGTALAIAGVCLVVMPDVSVGWRDVAASTFITAPRLLGLLAAITWALYSVLTRLWAGEQARGSVDLFLSITAGVLLMLSLFADEPRDWSLRATSEAVLLGLATCLAYRLWDLAMRRGNVLLVAASSYLTPLFSTLASCLYLSVVPPQQLWWGCLLLIAGSLLSWASVTRTGKDR